MSSVDASTISEDLKDSVGPTTLRWLGKMGSYDTQYFDRLQLGSLSVPTEQLSMVPARVRVYSHNPAGLQDYLLGCAVYSDSRMGCIPILSVMNVNEAFAVHETSEPADFVRVFVLQGKFVRDMVSDFGL